MHSKLIRLQTALLTLALLFTVLIPVSAYAEGETAVAQATADGSTTISDPNTLNAWERTQAYNNATTAVSGPTRRWRKTKSPSAAN